MSWKEHIKKVRESGDLTYKQAMVAASSPKPRRTLLLMNRKLLKHLCCMYI